MNKWEAIDGYTDRMKVRAGWVIRTTVPNGVALCYVPDMQHEWELEE